MYLNKQTLEQNMSVTTEQKNLHLLPHNREAYEKVMAHFENHQRAAIVHATGTGKSYCIAAIASIRRELGRKWAVGMVIWQCMIAWVAAFAVRWLMVLFMR